MNAWTKRHKLNIRELFTDPVVAIINFMSFAIEIA